MTFKLSDRGDKRIVLGLECRLEFPYARDSRLALRSKTGFHVYDLVGLSDALGFELSLNLSDPGDKRIVLGSKGILQFIHPSGVSGSFGFDDGK